MCGGVVELHIRPPLSYGVTKKPGGLIMKEEILEGERLADLLVRLASQKPVAFRNIFDSAIGEICPVVVTVLNGTLIQRSEAIEKRLDDGDKIIWLLMYAGG